jgi:hypothetical protein
VRLLAYLLTCCGPYLEWSYRMLFSNHAGVVVGAFTRFIIDLPMYVCTPARFRFKQMDEERKRLAAERKAEKEKERERRRKEKEAARAKRREEKAAGRAAAKVSGYLSIFVPRTEREERVLVRSAFVVCVYLHA